MSWQGELVTIVRHLIDDVDPDNYRYSNERLEKTVLVAAQIVSTEIVFEQTYNIDVESCLLNPDPTDPSTSRTLANKDDGFINLVSSKAACIILGSEWRTYSTQAVSVSDGPSSINMTAIASNLKSMYEMACERYDQYKFNMSAGNNAIGQAVLGPYSIGDIQYQKYR